MTRIAKGVCLFVMALCAATAWGNETKSAQLDEEMEDVKKALVELKRDLVILEEDLLFPACLLYTSPSPRDS